MISSQIILILFCSFFISCLFGHHFVFKFKRNGTLWVSNTSFGHPCYFITLTKSKFTKLLHLLTLSLKFTPTWKKIIKGGKKTRLIPNTYTPYFTELQDIKWWHHQLEKIFQIVIYRRRIWDIINWYGIFYCKKVLMPSFKSSYQVMRKLRGPTMEGQNATLMADCKNIPK